MPRLLNYIIPDFVHVLVGGRIVKSGGKELALELEDKGYGWIEEGLTVAAQIAGKRVQLKSVPGPVGVHSRNFSNERIYTTGWKSRFDLRAGLSLTYPWIKQQVDAAKK